MTHNILSAGDPYSPGDRVLEGSIDVANLGNASSIPAVSYSVGLSYGTVTDVLPPRQIKLGRSFRF